MALIFVDVEATGISPANGLITEFGAVEEKTKKTFHGILYEATPDPDNPAKPIITGNKVNSERRIMTLFAEWLKEVSPGQCTFVSDNPAYDWQWISYYFDKYYGSNPFGHSGRRISDFWAGLNGKWGETQSWKRFRVTKHTHNPVDDAMGNVEAFHTIMSQPRVMLNEYEARAIKNLIESLPDGYNTGDWYSDVPYKINKALKIT